MQATQESKKSFKDTLNLPQTDFPIRANAKIDDPAIIARWNSEKLFDTSYTHNAGAAKYILHDGPPYANGPIHLGHAYNKILKDIVCKSFRMQGFHVPVIPGWDCHGLPIELRVAQENPNASRVELIGACRQWAQNWIDVQRLSFKNLGVLMHWDKPYVTMDYSYEASIVSSFGDFVDKGFIERKNKTIAWCWSCQTVLASAEIEHKDRKDPSVYVLFPLAKKDQERLFPEVVGTINLLVWTTTPWTLPLNKALLVKPRGDYQLVDFKGNLCIVGAQVAPKLSAMLGIELVVLKSFKAEELSGSVAEHPFIERTTPLIFDDSVGTDEGTAFVHCAPGCGPIDYEIGVKNGLEIYSPINPNGTYASTIIPQELAGMHVNDGTESGQIWVIKKLHASGKLLHKNSINHSYPHCWRSHHGLIFRATPQWFCNLDKGGLKEKAVKAIESIDFIPERGESFLKATVENRWEWCLSRQRTWGAPIPAAICTSCDTAYTNKDFIEKVAQGIAKHGIEYWVEVDLKTILPENLECSGCKGTAFVKEEDILDVWFDSGVSHYAVLYNNPEQTYPADLYLEGLDQHRGWFQSSLLTSLVLEKEAAMKSIMTHGYTVDAKGQKMSKSLGNVVAPEDIINQIGTDGLRLWVASVGHDSDPSVSDTLLKNVAEVHRKIRNTARFLLSNLYDFSIETDAIPAEELLPIDRYALAKLIRLNEQVIADYTNVNFTRVFHELADYASSELSSFYLDIIKDRLYVEKTAGIERRSAQTVCWYILDTITPLMAPILSFTAELISDHYQKDKKASVHLQSFASSEKLQELVFPHIEPLDDARGNELSDVANTLKHENIIEQFLGDWEALKSIRSLVLKAIEVEREKGLIKHSLEAQVTLYINFEEPKYQSVAQLFETIKSNKHDINTFLKEYFIVSQFELVHTPAGLTPTHDGLVFVKVAQAAGTKCPRCWNFDTVSNEDGLDRRCTRVLRV